MKEIGTMLYHPDGRLKATAGMILANMIPSPPEAATVLLAVANGNGSLNQRIDTLSYLNSLSNCPKEQVDAAAVRIFKDTAMDSKTRVAAIHASNRRDPSDNLVDAIAAGLDDADCRVRFEAALSIWLFGIRLLFSYRATLFPWRRSGLR
jgi:hypothetical protein